MFLAFSSESAVVLAPVEVVPNDSTTAVIKTSHCRFCAQEKNFSELLDFSTNAETLNQLITILRFFKIDFVDLFNLKLPKTLCPTCYNEIIKCYNYFLTVKESQKILKQLFKVEDGSDNEVIIKIEPMDCLDIEINDQNIKQEKNTEFGNNSPTFEFESSSNFHQSYSSPGPSNSVNVEREFIVPIENTPGSSTAIKKKKIKKKKSFPILKSQLESTDEVPCELPCFVDDTTFKKNTQQEFNKMIEEMIKNNMNMKPNSNFAMGRSGDISWTGYPWRCKHCKVKFETMADLRNHSMQAHKRCFAYECADCPEGFNMFYPFMEHVRRHRYLLRHYCTHCNTHFNTVADCTRHELAYWSSGQKICNWCGEVYPNADALNTHKSALYQVRMPLREARKVPRVVPSASKDSDEGNQRPRTWEDYEWGCLECALSFTSAAELRSHTQSVHDKCFAMRCADCLVVKYDYPHFTKHVAGHRPYLRKYCPYCNQHFEDANELKTHTEEHLTGPQRACCGCGQIFLSKEDEIQHMQQFAPRRSHKYLTTEELTCQVCQKVLCNTTALRTHIKIHDETRKKDNCCHLCGKQFSTKHNLKHHMQRHDDKKYECQVCSRTFVLERYLKNHVLTHIEEKPYNCDLCSKGFIKKHMLRRHINIRHNNSMMVRKYKCSLCPKRFSASTQLKNHLNAHTGTTPYNCLNCEKSFTNWGNCNKHMMRIHGTTLATTKMTERGRIPIGEEMPEITTDVKEWMAEVIKPKLIRK